MSFDTNKINLQQPTQLCQMNGKDTVCVKTRVCFTYNIKSEKETDPETCETLNISVLVQILIPQSQNSHILITYTHKMTCPVKSWNACLWFIGLVNKYRKRPWSRKGSSSWMPVYSVCVHIVSVWLIHFDCIMFPYFIEHSSDQHISYFIRLCVNFKQRLPLSVGVFTEGRCNFTYKDSKKPVCVCVCVCVVIHYTLTLDSLRAISRARFKDTDERKIQRNVTIRSTEKCSEISFYMSASKSVHTQTHTHVFLSLWGSSIAIIITVCLQK